MKQLEVKITIVFRWWRGDGKPVIKTHIPQLSEHAEERIAELKKGGVSNGELITEINGINYRGWFETK